MSFTSKCDDQIPNFFLLNPFNLTDKIPSALRWLELPLFIISRKITPTILKNVNIKWLL